MSSSSSQQYQLDLLTMLRSDRSRDDTARRVAARERRNRRSPPPPPPPPIPLVPIYCGADQDRPVTVKVLADDSDRRRYSGTFLPIPLPTTSQASRSRSISPDRKRSRRSNGCGARVHSRAFGDRRWRASVEGVNADVVIPLDSQYFSAEDRRLCQISEETCGCVHAGVGCAICGNPLGALYKPCASHSRPSSVTAPSQGSVYSVGSAHYMFLKTAVSPPLPTSSTGPITLPPSIRRRRVVPPPRTPPPRDTMPLLLDSESDEDDMHRTEPAAYWRPFLLRTPPPATETLPAPDSSASISHASQATVAEASDRAFDTWADATLARAGATVATDAPAGSQRRTLAAQRSASSAASAHSVGASNAAEDAVRDEDLRRAFQRAGARHGAMMEATRRLLSREPSSEAPSQAAAANSSSNTSLPTWWVPGPVRVGGSFRAVGSSVNSVSRQILDGSSSETIIRSTAEPAGEEEKDAESQPMQRAFFNR